METIDILGVPHAYTLTAPTVSPQVLVFIHGWLLSREYWQPLIDRLSPHYQCLTYDLRGFGHSQPRLGTASVDSKNLPQQASVEAIAAQAQSLSRNSEQASLAEFSNYTPAAYARDLGILLQQLNINHAWLIGHSLGGTIALWGANQLPHCVKGVICLNAGGGIYLKEEFERFQKAGQQMLKLRPRWLCNFPLIDLLFTRSTVAKPIARCWGRQRVVDFVIADMEAALGTLLDSTTEAEVHRLPQIVSQLKQPVYFMAGQKDPIMEPQYVRHLASFHSMFGTCGDNVIEIPDCGHMAMVEQPDAVATQMQTILTGHPA